VTDGELDLGKYSPSPQLNVASLILHAFTWPSGMLPSVSFGEISLEKEAKLCSCFLELCCMFFPSLLYLIPIET